jgi:hypothetical protein
MRARLWRTHMQHWYAMLRFFFFSSSVSLFFVIWLCIGGRRVGGGGSGQVQSRCCGRRLSNRIFFSLLFPDIWGELTSKTCITFVFVFSNSACPEHKWGPNCSNSCPCLNGAKCDPVNGSCTCTAGWKGLHCDYPCPKNYYGQSCSLKCQVIILSPEHLLSCPPSQNAPFPFSPFADCFFFPPFVCVSTVQESSLLRSGFGSMRLSTRMEWTTVTFI